MRCEQFMNYLFPLCQYGCVIERNTSGLTPERREFGGCRKGAKMGDVIWVVVTIAFFALAVGYVHFCDRVK